MELHRDAYEVLQITPAAHADVIRAAYRALAALYHPDRDGSEASLHRMAELNAAYAKLRTADLRRAYDGLRSRRTAPGAHSSAGMTAFQVTPSGTARDPGVLDFGRYMGWTIAQVAHHDPDYLRWLSRHSSGIRYRTRIQEAIAAVARTSAAQRVGG